jgi:hypothetical protein
MTRNMACRAEAQRRLERDIRNQVVIDRMKRLDTKGRLMVVFYKLERRSLLVGALFSLAAWIATCLFLWA